MRIYERPSKRAFAWRFCFIVSFILFFCGVTMAAMGRIDYQYHIGARQVVGVVTSDKSPLLFWAINSFLIVSGAISAVFTGVRLARFKREENETA